MPIDELEQKIDTNKKNGMEPQEIINFCKNDTNVQELWKKLSQTTNLLENQNNRKFRNAIISATLNNWKFQEDIQSKIKKWVWWLTDSDIFLLYLQCLTDNFWNWNETLFLSKKWDVLTRYWWQGLLRYIRKKYNNPKYEFWKWWPNIISQQSQNNLSSLTTKRETTLPNNMNLSTFWESNTYIPKEFSKLETWAKENFLREYNKEKEASKKRNAEKWDKINDYIQYDLLKFSLKKYQELIEKKHTWIINWIYWSNENYNNQQKLAKKYFEDLEKIDKNFPEIQEIIKNLTEYYKELEKIQKEYLKNENEEIAQKKYELYIAEVEKKWAEMWINEIKKSFTQEAKSPKDAIKFCENVNKLEEFQSEQEKIKNKYGKIIDNYENFINSKWKLIKKYGKDKLQQWTESYKEYQEKIKECDNQNKWFDLKKYKLYSNKISKSDISKHLDNLQILSNSICIESENFPIRSIKEDYEFQKREQAKTDKRWWDLKNNNYFLYQVCSIWARWLNALVSSTRWTGVKLWAVICSLWHDDDEMVAVRERAWNWFWNPHFNISTDQSKSIYENWKINFNWDNWPWIIAESIVNMYTLIWWWWAIAKWITKWATSIWIWMWARWINIAWKAWLFSSWFMQQVWPSFQEWFNAWMTWNQALLYSMISAGLQGWLELISPNEFLLWSWNKLAKSYIREILKTESKESLKAIWKLFLKNVWSEIAEEIFQEEVQLAAGNLVNMWANDKYNLTGDNKLDADWNPKNFLATAMVTALTTWIVAWWGFSMQTPWMWNNQSRIQLIQQIQNNQGLHSDVMNVLDKAIAWNIKIPNVNIQELQELKWILNNTVNTNSYFNEKSHKIFEWNTEKAESNSKFSDRILSEIDEQNKSQKLEELRKEITEQYKQTTWEELELSDEQLLSILDAHEQDWKLWELSIWQLRVKVKILSEAITDPKARRFLLEAGFCGQIEYKWNINKIKELTDSCNELLNDLKTVRNYTFDIDELYENFRKNSYSLDKSNLDYNKINNIIQEYNNINWKYDQMINILRNICNKTTIRWQFKTLHDFIKEGYYTISDAELNNLKELEDYCRRMIENTSNHLQYWTTQSNKWINVILNNLKIVTNNDLVNNETEEKCNRCNELLYTIKRNAEYTKNEIHETYSDARQIQREQQNWINNYFNWKSHKIFKWDSWKAKLNSKTSDRILSEINEQNKSEKLEELKKEISEQYEKSTWEKLKLSDEQVLSILDAHEQDWKLWELSIWQLRVKVKILSESITDPKVRRFLLEAGFCWSRFRDFDTNIENNLLDQNTGDEMLAASWVLFNNVVLDETNEQNELNITDKVDIQTNIYKAWDEIIIRKNDGNLSTATIQEYNNETWEYTIYYKNWDWSISIDSLTIEEMNSLNLAINPWEDNENAIFWDWTYKFWDEVTINLENWELIQWFICAYDTKTNAFVVEWTENGNKKKKICTKEYLDIYNDDSDVSIVEDPDVSIVEDPDVSIVEDPDVSIVNSIHESQQIINWTERPDRWINTERREISEVHRNSDVVAIWDLHGEYIALKWNMEYAWLAREVNWHLEWIWWNKKVVFQWDILADRWTDWLRILSEIHQLREQARQEWWDIDIIIGNHDDFMISYLLWEWTHLDWRFQASYSFQWMGLTELLDFIWIKREWIIYEEYNGELERHCPDFTTLIWKNIEILNAMRNTPEWRLILEEICNMKLISQVDDVLYCHTNPTSQMIELLTTWKYDWNIDLGNWETKYVNIKISEWNTTIQENINTLNNMYQQFLRKVLLWENTNTISLDIFNWISDIILNTWNRYTWLNGESANLLRNSWINMISHWHSGWSNKRWYTNNQIEIWWVKVVDTDYSYWKGWEINWQHSVSVIKREWWVNYIWDNVAYANLEYPIWSEVYAKFDKWWEQKARIESYNPRTKEYTVIIDWNSDGWIILKAENLRNVMDTEFVIDKWNQIRRYKTELPTEKHSPTHIQETSNKLNELITEADKPKLKQSWFKKEYPDDKCENDVQRFIERAQEREVAHKQIFLELGQRSNAQALFIWPPKKAERIVEKVKNECILDWEGWLEAITDFTRSTILFDNYSEFVRWIEVLKQMQQEWRIAKLRIRDRINRKWCNDMIINIETADWYVSEVQFHIPETLILKDGFIWPQVEKLYKDKFNIEFDNYIFTEKIYDLKSDNEYQNKKNKYEKIIETINKKKDKKLKLPEQWKEIHWHDIYDIRRILDKRQKDPDLMWELDSDDVISLNKTLEKISDSLADEARNRYGNRTI